MPKFDVDLENDIQRPLSNNIYAVEISGSSNKADKNGSDMITWQMTVIDPGENFGRELYYLTNLQNNVKLADGSINKNARRRANFYLREFFETIKAPYGADGFTTEAALHCKARVRVKQETVDGRVFERVDAVMPFDS